MKHFRLYEEYRIGDKKIEPELQELVNQNEQYSDLIEEFDLIPDEINDNHIRLKNKEIGLDVVVDVAMNKIIVKLNNKTLHDSSFFLVDKRTNTLTREGRLKSKASHLFYFLALGLMEAVWRHNYPSVLYILDEKLSEEDLKKVIQGTELTEHDIRTRSFGNGKQKYHLLKNIVELSPKYSLKLEHLPKSIDYDKDSKSNLKEIEKLAPGFL